MASLSSIANIQKKAKKNKNKQIFILKVLMYMGVRKIVKEEISKLLSEKRMLSEYKNPRDLETVRACGDMLQNLHDNIVKNGVSKREITIVMMSKIIGEIRHLEQMMEM